MSYFPPNRTPSPKDMTPLLNERDVSPFENQERFHLKSPETTGYNPTTATAPPKTKRRPTFSGPNQDRDSIDSAVFTTPHFHEEFEITNALGHLASRANSVNTMTSHSALRDLRNYDPRNNPSAKQSSNNRRQSHTSNLSSSVPYKPISTKHRVSVPVSTGGFNHSSQHEWTRHNQLNRGYGSLASSSPIANLMETAHAASAKNKMGNDQSDGEDDDDDDLNFHSNPSSRRSSRSSSLDDVCFPLDQLDTNGAEKNWPDLVVLEDFYLEETTRLKEEAFKETNEANYRFDFNNNEQNDQNSSDIASSSGVGFSYPIVTKVDAPPMLGNHKINETETYTGRLRPPKINPFDRSKTNNVDFLRTINYPPQIINNNPEHFRFTYFREDLDSTVHSPTISGLLQPAQKFEDIFSYQEYAKKSKIESSRQGSHPNSIKEPTPEPPVTKSETPSLSIDPDAHVPPFWLDILNPTEEEMKVLSKAFSIHPLTTEDIFLGETREKVELFKDYYFVCFRSFDIVQEKMKRRNIEAASAAKESQNWVPKSPDGFFSKIFGLRNRRQSSALSAHSVQSDTSSMKRQAREIELEKFKRKSGDRHKPKGGELEPLNVYILVFRHAVLTFHFAPTPHPVNVRRRARLLNEYLTVSADWIAYALIDDITDAFGPMIESIEDEVNNIEDTILSMTQDSDSDDSDSDSDGEEDLFSIGRRPSLKQRDSTLSDKKSIRSFSTASTRSTSSNIIEWKRKGHMLKRIGETRKRVMSLLRLLGSKADVIKGFAKRCNEQWEIAPRSEIGMYLGDIQDHIVTMVQSLNHYEKLLARSHSNYLAQINIDMTRVNNDMNDVLGKITILGTVVLPMNVITGLWGMNVIVPGQEYEGLMWFWGLVCFMLLIAVYGYIFAKRVSGI